jgi:hypothetical protein
VSSSIVRIADRSAVIAAAWAVLRKRAEVIRASLSHRLEAGVVIILDTGCVSIVGEL